MTAVPTHSLPAILLSAMLCPVAWAQATATAPVPLLDATGQISSQWTRVSLPSNKGIAAPTIDVASTDTPATQAVRISSASSYGHLLQKGPWPAGQLSWQWRIDKGLQQADLQTKAGDDAALKVCVSFDHHDDNVPWGERLLLKFARSQSALDLPSATVCYVWDNRYAIGTTGANPYTKRVRYMVLRSGMTQARSWQTQQRNLAQDFLFLFGDETQVVPPVSAIAVGADTDNTQESALGWVRNMSWKSLGTP